MRLILLVPNVIKNYTDRFPEVSNNAYKYFNYDNRVVEERVDRGDQKPLYKGPEDLCDGDYASLVAHAKTLINPILVKYGYTVACEDALNLAVRSFQNGNFDGKINANKFAVLLKDMIGNNENLNKPFKGDCNMLKNAKEYTERLDKIAEELEKISPELAYHVDSISDVIEGRREASTLKFDADEARYMAGRFNSNVRSREADEPYMDKFNQNNFEQVITVKRNPVPINVAGGAVPASPYTKVMEEPAAAPAAPEQK